MKRTTESRNQREGRYAGKGWRYDCSTDRARAGHRRSGQDGRNGSLRERIPPGGWYGDPIGGGWGCA